MRTSLQTATWILAGTLALVSLEAQSATGFRVDKSQQAQIHSGMNTNEVQRALGRPERVVKYGNQPGPTWSYEVLGARCDTIFEVDFGADDKVLKSGERQEWRDTPCDSD